MSVPILRLFSWTPCFAILAIAVSYAAAIAEEPEKRPDAGIFFSVPGAKDCAYDESRQRLYVTTLKQVVVIDTKERKTVESIDLLGGVQSCDISPDFKHLAVAPINAQAIYWIDLENLEVTQVKFKAPGSETGVYDLCVGSDNTVLFGTTFAGSGGVSLRKFDPETNKVETVRGVNMDSVITASGDRRYAAIAEGNISNGPVSVYDFKEKKLTKAANMDCFHYEFATSSEAKYFARPHAKGCDLYDGKGTKLGTLDGRPVICAAFHPKTDQLFVMRHGELSIQQYDVQGSKLANSYPLDQPLAIKGDVNVFAQLQPVGRDFVIAHFRGQVNFRTFKSGRLKVSDDGKNLFAVIPSGVYMFDVKDAPKTSASPKRPIKVIEAEP
jgi:hypothetical protein